jgi:hypothetical protein
MARISGHVPRLGALVLAVVVAAVAYSVYESGQSTGSDSASPAPRGAGLAALNPTNDSTKAPNPEPKPNRDSKRPRHTAEGDVPIVASEVAFTPDSGAAPGPGGSALRPVATKPPVRSPKSGGGNGVDRELRRLIDGPRPKAKPKSPAPKPKSPAPKPKSPTPKPVAPAPSPNAPAPGGAPTAPPPAPAPAGDPETGLDDTPVGGLDPNDLGGPIDEINAPVPVAPPPAPAPAPAPSADPEAGLDDTGAGGLDQTDTGGQVDTTTPGTGG